MKILITGFQPFGGETVNPSYEAVRLLPDKIGGAEIVKEELPVVFGKSGDALEEAIERHKPDAVLCVGQAGGRSSVTIEKVAINLDEARIADNAGQKPEDMPIRRDGPDAYFARLPVKDIVKNIRGNGIPANISYTAGTYVCNHVMYRLLYFIERKYPHMQGGFIHVPYDTAQVLEKPDGTASMPVAMIAKALECAAAVISTPSLRA
ncbi:MAG: pyroglutamyl-peptidase I [Defluviitaleaceae bacterium]|nr:pyroglutamyl-peptidase I [Defluviitaleaceae bacterium]MCL2835264.1 pyroglutamyl-peptidase I [Defluviitaleaceae bacterium]